MSGFNNNTAVSLCALTTSAVLVPRNLMKIVNYSCFILVCKIKFGQHKYKIKRNKTYFI